jgi:hypothetical protein
MTSTTTKSVTRRDYETLRGQLHKKCQDLLRQLSQAQGDEWDRIWNELGQCPTVPPLPGAYVYLLSEPDGTYMGTVRTRAEIRELRNDGLDFTARRAKGLYPDHRPLAEKYLRLYEEARR